jgi:hypothetical protein
MATRKSDKTIIKEQIAEIEKLKKDLKYAEDYKSQYQNEKNELQKELESVHTALDTMFVPRRVKVGYNETTMTVASRLWAWQAGARIKPSEKTEIE